MTRKAVVVLGIAAAISCATVVCAADRANGAGISFQKFADHVDIDLNNKPVTTFHFESKWDKPFLYPIRTLSGMVISRGYPVEPRAGEERDHAWHRGFWYGHGDINGQDFWREKEDHTTSRMVIDGEPKITGRTIEARFAMIPPSGKRMGTIVERYSFTPDGPNLVIDTTISVIADGGQALRFGDSDDGGFGFRLSDEFRQDRGAQLTNSEGQSGTENMWGKPARWVRYSAAVGGVQRGVVMLDHPSNLRSPSRWHARGYSLCSANPFALGSFMKDKKVDGSWTLPAGQTLRLKYRIIVYDGELSREQVDKSYTAFANQKD